MASKTEVANIYKIKEALVDIKAAAKEEIKAQVEADNPDLINAWTHVLADATKMHANWTDIGLKQFPEFFGKIVTKGGGTR